MPTNPKPLLETIADAIVEAQKRRIYGLYDYTNYIGDEPPHVVRYEPTSEIIKSFKNPKPARQLYEKLAREYVAKEVLHAFMDWMQNDLYRYMVKVGMRP